MSAESMENDVHDEFREALKLPDLPLKSAAAALRHRIPQIEKFMAQGVARETIVEEFRRQGVGVTVHGLSTFLSRERKERERRSRPALALGPPEERTTPATSCPPVSQALRDIAPPVKLELDEDRMEAGLDPKKRAALADRYLNKPRPVIGRNLKGESE